jgi:hypothetical protein
MNPSLQLGTCLELIVEGDQVRDSRRGVRRQNGNEFMEALSSKDVPSHSNNHGLDVVATERHQDLPDNSTSGEIRYARPPDEPRVGQQSGESKSQKGRMLCNVQFVLLFLLLVGIFTWLVAASPRRDSSSVPSSEAGKLDSDSVFLIGMTRNRCHRCHRCRVLISTRHVCSYQY